MLAAIKAFLAGFKTYFYGVIIVVVIATTIWYTIHERNVGEAKIVARDVIINTQRQKIADQAAQHTKDVQALAQQLSDDLGDVYEKAINTPVVDPPHVLCYRPRAPAGSGGVPKAPGDKPSDSGAADERAEAPVDIGPAVTEVGKDADAQINALLDQIQVLTDEMNGKSK